MSYSAGHSGLSTRSASIIAAKEANRFHLLRIDGYSQTKTLLPGQKLSSPGFDIGGHSWHIDYYPNGRDPAASFNAISLYLQLTDHTQQGLPKVKARYKFSLLDNSGKAAYEVPTVIGSFTSVVPQVNNPYYHGNVAMVGGSEEPGPGCGHEEFIATEELERLREHLVRDDSIVIRCDVAVTQIDASWLHEELDALGLEDNQEDFDEEGYGVGSNVGPMTPNTSNGVWPNDPVGAVVTDDRAAIIDGVLAMRCILALSLKRQIL